KILKSFYQFLAFTDTLWLEVSQYPELIAQFSSGNQTRIKQGLTAKAPLEGWRYGPKEIVKKFQIHHRVAIEYGGSVYDIDNLRIVTPRLHDEIHYRR
ncbi:TPA: HNH endonuclease signature motif containing protein, partial [Escherichia coli]